MLNVISIIQCIDQVFTNLIFIPMIFVLLPALSGTDQLIPATDFL